MSQPPPAEREPRLDEVVLTAAGLTGEKREAYLRGVAAARPSLADLARRRVERYETVDDSFLDTPAAERLAGADGDGPAITDEPLPAEERFELGRCLGEGGMGRVLFAHDRQLDRPVALKFLHHDDPEVLRLLLREARLQARVRHDNVLEIYDSGRLDGRPFIAMRYVEGGTLADAGPRLSLERKVRLLAQAARGLHAAHRTGLLHCDVKPSNILVEEGDGGEPRALVTDFGLATDAGHDPEQEELGGTPQYVAPERLTGASPADRRADVYSLGATMYRVLTGTAPFVGGHTLDVLRGVAAGELPPPRQRAPALPAELEAIVLRCMALDPEDRYRSARAVADDLERFLDGEVVEAYAAGLAYRLTRFALRHRALVALAGAALAALAVAVVAVAVFALRADRARQRAEVHRGQAEGLIGFMLDDLREKLEPVGRLDILEDVGDRAMDYFEQMPADSRGDAARSRRAQALRQIGEVKMAQGDLGAAHEAFHASLELAREGGAGAAGAGGAGAQRQMEALLRIGQVRRSEGDLEAAEAAFIDALELAEALAGGAPADASPGDELQSQRHIALCAALFWVGQVRYEQGDYPAALSFMERYLEIAERWSEASQDATWRLELAQATSNVGSVRQRMGDLEGALEAFRRRLAIVRALVEEDPDHAGWRQDLALAHNTLGLALQSAGELDAAQEHFASQVEIQQRLVDRDPANARWAQRLGAAHAFLGSSALQRGQLAAARAAFREQLRIAERLAERDPRNGEWRRGLAVAHRSVAEALHFQGAAEAALEHLTQAAEIFARLADREPQNRGWKLQLAITHAARGNVLHGAGQARAAEREARSALALLEDVEQVSPEPHSRVEALLLLGSALQNLGQPDVARRHWLLALDLIEPLAEERGQLWQLAAWARVLHLLGRDEQAAVPLRTLRAAGYRKPDLAGLL